MEDIYAYACTYMQVITEKRGLTCEREQRKYIGGFRKGKGENKVILISIK